MFTDNRPTYAQILNHRETLRARGATSLELARMRWCIGGAWYVIETSQYIGDDEPHFNFRLAEPVFQLRK